MRRWFLTGLVILCGCGRDDPAPLPGSGAEAPAAPAAAAPAPASVVVPVEDDSLGIPPAVYRALPERVPAVERIVPAGWRIEHRADGDLNGDGRADVALVLRQDSAANIIRHDGFGQNPLDANPSILVVALAEERGYRLIARNHDFIPRHTNPGMEYPLQESPAIARGVLSIRLNLFMSAGGWTMSNATARFRYQDGALRLIGHDYSEVRRNTGDTLDRSVNFLTRRVSTVTSHLSAEQEPPAVWTRLPDGPLLTLDQVGDGLEFQPVPDE